MMLLNVLLLIGLSVVVSFFDAAVTVLSFCHFHARFCYNFNKVSVSVTLQSRNVAAF